MDGKAILSCLTLAIECRNRTITTIEGISGTNELHPVQQSFVEHGAIQCGFCTPGIIMTSKALLDANPTPTDDEINEALAGSFCRCTGYVKIKEAVKNVNKA
jgi:carbon-monoxide dehydrogenase small subunit